MQHHTNAFSPSLDREREEVWGIVGGMGPLASAAFLQTIYDVSAGQPEQGMPKVIVLSDPTFPDRTECLASGRQRLLRDRLESSLEQLSAAGATRAVICCMTIHAVAPQLSPVLRGMLVSLVDTALSGIVQAGGTHLMLCTKGVRRARLLEDHPLWEQARARLRMLDDNDQNAIHDLIYELKSNRRHPGQLALLLRLRDAYGADGLVAGCTELHLISRAAEIPGAPLSWIDPLLTIARRMQPSFVPGYSAPRTVSAI